MTMQGMKFGKSGGKVGSALSNDIAGELTKEGIVPGKKVSKAKTHEFKTSAGKIESKGRR